MVAHMASPNESSSPTQLDFDLLLASAVGPLTEPSCSTKVEQMDLLVDGYLAHTLTPLCAEKYLRLFKKCLEKTQDASLVAQDAGWIVTCSKTAQKLHQHQQGKQKRLFSHRPVQSLPPTLPPSPPRPSQIRHDAAHDLPHRSCEEAFDHRVDLYRGTVVPQLTWIGVTEATGVICPIWFTQHDGTLGVPYAIAHNGGARDMLCDPMALAPELLGRSNVNVRVRIEWPGYKEFHYEFRILDLKLGERVPIAMFRLVERVARGLHRLYLEGERDPDRFCEHWKLGEEDGIELDDLNIIGLVHISRGTWMPILQLNQHVIPRCEYYFVDGVGEKQETNEEEPDQDETRKRKKGARGSSPAEDGGETPPKRNGKRKRML